MLIPVFNVALPVPLPQTFHYLPLSDTPSRNNIGCRVSVPFGKQQLIGVIVGIDHIEHTPRLRPLYAQLDASPLFHGELLKSLHWLARYTHAPLGEVLSTALPSNLRRGNPVPDTNTWAWQLTKAGHMAVPSLRAGAKPKQLAQLLQKTPCGEETLALHLGTSWRNTIRQLSKRGFIERITQPNSMSAPKKQHGFTLNSEQQNAVNKISETRGQFKTFLLDGVTGSGKTEVYLQAMTHCLTHNQQVLVLVPEIGLTPQMLSRFRAYLGIPIHTLHSALNDNERAQVWAAAWRGEARIIIGTRSAIFTPLPNPGLIVIDEEHDHSYKQTDGIRYHARDFALMRSKLLNIPIILGSATPSLESLHNAISGRYTHLRMRQRAGVARSPSVSILDVRKQPLQAGLSPKLLSNITDAIKDGGQVLVFKNRRGYAPVLLCHDCGWHAQCQHCDTAMTVHHNRHHHLQCHHCGIRRQKPDACPECSGLALQPQGIGTERLEECLSTLFTNIPVVRVDRGNTRRRDALASILNTLADQPGILIGTQMLAKGHDLKQLTLAAIVGIDEGLFNADFRGNEKLAQLLIQVAGRAGRADKPGQVVLQTHHPEHPLLHTLINGGYHAFVTTELAQRSEAGLPPFTHLALLRAEAKQATHATAFLKAAKAMLCRNSSSQCKIYGPMPAPMPRRAGYQREQLLLSTTVRRQLHHTLDCVLQEIYALPMARKVRWSLDIDPVDLC